MAEAKKRKGAAQRIKEQGRSLVWSTFNEEEKADLRAAAGIAGVPMSQLVRDSALAEAKKILEKFRNQP